MPEQPKRICTYPGCNTLVIERRCHKHPYPKGPRKKPQAKLYGTRRWQANRARELRMFPLCRYRYKCDGAPSTEVDHRDNDQGNNNPENLVACCKRCHSYKTATQDMKRDGGKFNGRRT